MAPATAPWYKRVLPAGQTQLTAALSHDPTLVSVELGGNEVLNGSSGLVLDNVTIVALASFIAPYTAILNSLACRKVLLVGMPADVRNRPDDACRERDLGRSRGVRGDPSPLGHRFRARAAARAVLATYGVRLLPNESSNVTGLEVRRRPYISTYCNRSGDSRGARRYNANA